MKNSFDARHRERRATAFWTLTPYPEADTEPAIAPTLPIVAMTSFITWCAMNKVPPTLERTEIVVTQNLQVQTDLGEDWIQAGSKASSVIVIPVILTGNTRLAPQAKSVNGASGGITSMMPNRAKTSLAIVRADLG